MRHNLRHRTRYFTSARLLLGFVLALATAIQATHPHAHAARGAGTPLVVAAH